MSEQKGLTSKRKSILIIAPRVPFPLDAGGKIAIYSAIEAISNHFNVFLVIVTDEQVTKVQVESMGSISKECKVFYFSKSKCRINTVKSLYNRLPLQTNYFYHSKVQDYVNELSPHIDFGYSFMIRTSAYFNNFPKFKVINFIDSLYLSYSRSVAQTSSLLWKIIYGYEIKILKKYELKCIKDFDKNIFVNSNEASYWANYAPNVHCLPFGVEQSIIEYDKIDHSYKDSIIFLGKMDYQPNIDAVQWFCEKVMTKMSDYIRLIIVGGSPSKEVRELPQKYKNVKVTGFVEDPYAMIRGCIAVVAPMQTGGGLQTKVLTAMALGAKVIAPKWVIEPVPGARINFNILVSEEPEEYAKLVMDIYQNPSNFIDIGENARHTALEKFSWVHYQTENLRLFNE